MGPVILFANNHIVAKLVIDPIDEGRVCERELNPSSKDSRLVRPPIEAGMTP